MGVVTDIQRFSLNDGPGIRTTVFFKGCNARCSWCHNPETIKMEPEVLVYPNKCIKCGACVGFDPAVAVKGLPPARELLSVKSAEACFSGALVVAGREMSVAEVMAEIEQDINYYRNSGGGVTLSGGEVMLQKDFAKALLMQCRAKGIATAIETNLLYDYSLLENLLDVLDLVMADVKLLDRAGHQEQVRLGNGPVLENVRKLAKSGVPYILRTPVIPGVNDDEESIRSIAGFIKENDDHLLYYELLNFNPLGASKYEALGDPYRYTKTRPLSNDVMDRLQKVAGQCGIPVRVG